MPARVYVETSVPSAYVSTRTDPGSVFRREVTRRWWAEQREQFETLISDNVVIELADGKWPGQDEALHLVAPVPKLAIDDTILRVMETYITERLVPDAPGGDALHLAVACAHEVDFLLTWNIRHLANPNKTAHLIVINRRLRIGTPQIVTPDALWTE